MDEKDEIYLFPKTLVTKLVTKSFISLLASEVINTPNEITSPNPNKLLLYFTSHKLSAGTYVMIRSPMIRTRMNGSVADVTCPIVFLKRKLDIKRFIPTGGIKYAISRLARKMMPRWIGSTPYCFAIGTMSGTTTIAEKISIIIPITSKKMFKIIRKTILLSTTCRINSKSFCGIC